MTFDPQKLDIRALQFRDLDAIEALLPEALTARSSGSILDLVSHLDRIRSYYGLLTLLSLLPTDYKHVFSAFVAEKNRKIQAAIQVSPSNRNETTWRVDRLIADPGSGAQDSSTALIRHCLQNLWKARTWIAEVKVSNTDAMAIYRQNGFQPLTQIAHWDFEPALLAKLAQREPDLPNLLPVSNSDAHLLYQLDTVSMLPHVRQVYDRHVSDFKTGLLDSLMEGFKRWMSKTESVAGYVFEPQRKAAIGYFQMQLCQQGTFPHCAELTVHPAYTWLYPELLTQMARVAREYPAQSLRLTSADYQTEREEFFQQLGARAVEHTQLMSRSVWHKLRETKQVTLEGLQLSDVLGSLQPARKPIPSRWIQPPYNLDRRAEDSKSDSTKSDLN
ncbi:MAG: GNAT family N-acetyltransferase [Geitlerinemataceae cyanobacterium]